MSDLKDTEPVVLQTDVEGSKRRGWFILLLGFGGFCLWAFIAPLDQGVIMPSQVIVAGDTKIVQHPYGGVVEVIHVTEGQPVKQGQPLITLNATLAKAQMDIVRTNWISAEATRGRLTAELVGGSEITFPAWFLQNSEDDRVRAAVNVQSALFKARRSVHVAQRDTYRESMESLKASIGLSSQRLLARQDRLSSIEAQLKSADEMLEAGFMARNKYLEIKSAKQALVTELLDEQSKLTALRSQLAEKRLGLSQFEATRLAEIQQELSATQKSIDELEDKLIAESYDKDATVIKSPADGYVSNLRVNTQGGVVNPADILLEVVPNGLPLQLQGKMPVSLVGKVQPDMEVEVLFSSLDAQATPNFKGKVLTVSADAIVPQTAPESMSPYYLVQIDFLETDQIKLQQLGILAGTPAEAFVKSGERNLIAYLFKPIVDRMRVALTEK